MPNLFNAKSFLLARHRARRERVLYVWVALSDMAGVRRAMD